MQKKKILVWALLLAGLLFWLTRPSDQDALAEVLSRGELRVIMPNTPATFYEYREGYAGFEYELVRAYADYLGVELRIRRASSPAEMEQALLTGQVDLVAGGVGVTQERLLRFTLSQPLLLVDQLVVYRRGSARPRSWSDLEGGQLGVVAGSREAEILREAQALFPELSWMETTELDALELLRRVQERELDYALVTSQDFNINRFFFPQVGIGFEPEAPTELVWLLSAQAQGGLVRTVNHFLNWAQETGKIEQIRERYYQHEEHLEYVGAALFLRHVRNRLPLYEEHFRLAGEAQDLDWRLLAAVGFQESHWRRNAVSPTGVRGLMMLTQRTAAELGVNRLDPYQSIEGGARYLRRLYDRVPERIPEPDRLYMALAAYNVGFGHLEDARRITQSQGFDPDSWEDVARHLPLLAEREWFRQTRFGYARGREPVVYVTNIRRYLQLLEWYQLTQENFIERLENPATRADPEMAFDHIPPLS
ncbi:membrane-bound lytic murein transglycosylase MltF [Marinospirillum sp. MEB164]|uniref:Membrane-bound lytic murein transglycosylase F n=1 Tax=Marinospirillum alkalitolerans TaxID=3123374 RepID=A0ABW8PUD0_9GAMM